VDSLLQDLRYGMRMLAKSPGFALIAILTLALGIGANTAVFSIVNAVLLRPLPYRQPQQLVKVWGQYSKQGIPQNWISEPEWWDMRAELRSFDAMAAFSTGGGANLTRAGSEPLRVTTSQASADLFPLLGVATKQGRVFTADDDQPGHDHVALIDNGFWKTQMASDSNIVGKSIQLNGETYAIVGVLPEGFNFGGDTNLWTPLALDRAKPNDRGNHYLEVVARLKPGVTLPQASAELQAFVDRMTTRFPDNYRTSSGFGMFLRPLQTEIAGDVRPGLLVVFGSVGFVLLIACINLANLLLARGSSRSREMAVRAALGAGRLRLVRQLVTESIVMAVIGGGIGMMLAVWATELLRRMAGTALPSSANVSIDARVLLFAAGVSIATGIFFSLIPALQMSSPVIYESLKDAARGTSAGAGHKLRSGLVVAEISLALVLLVAAGLMVRSLQQLMQVSPGFQTEHLLSFRVSLPQSRYADANAAAAFYRDLTDKLRTLPGVKQAGAVTVLPMSGLHSSGSTFVDQTSVEGLQVFRPFQKAFIEADQRRVTPGYLEAMQIPLVRGRSLTAGDDANAPPVAVVDEEFVKRFWPDRDAIGQRVATGSIPKSNPPVPLWRTVVGVVGHIKNDSLDQQGREQVYLPSTQIPFPTRTMYIAVRVNGDPAALAAAIQHDVNSLDPSLPLYEVKTMDELLGASVASRRFNMMLLVVFGAMALTLAAIGTYGVMSYTVSQRTQELGIRMALGATPQDLLRMVVGSAMRLAALGVGIGIVAALGATRLMTVLLFGVRSSNPLTFAVVAVVLVATALAATYIPARRATRVDPMVALRYE
jgi:putative ABC transport system permease protein